MSIEGDDNRMFGYLSNHNTTISRFYDGDFTGCYYGLFGTMSSPCDAVIFGWLGCLLDFMTARKVWHVYHSGLLFPLRSGVAHENRYVGYESSLLATLSVSSKPTC